MTEAHERLRADWSRADYVAAAIAFGIYAIENAQPGTFQGRAMNPDEVVNRIHALHKLVDPCNCYSVTAEQEPRYGSYGELTRPAEGVTRVRLHGEHYRIEVAQTSAIQSLADLLFEKFGAE